MRGSARFAIEVRDRHAGAAQGGNRIAGRVDEPPFQWKRLSGACNVQHGAIAEGRREADEIESDAVRGLRARTG
jgi:hypothetical protein